MHFLMSTLPRKLNYTNFLFLIFPLLCKISTVLSIKILLIFYCLPFREFQYTGSSIPFQKTTRFLPYSRIYSDHFDRSTKLAWLLDRRKIGTSSSVPRNNDSARLDDAYVWDPSLSATSWSRESD